MNVKDPQTGVLHYSSADLQSWHSLNDAGRAGIVPEIPVPNSVNASRLGESDGIVPSIWVRTIASKSMRHAEEMKRGTPTVCCLRTQTEFFQRAWYGWNGT